MSIRNALASVAVKDLPKSIQWYEKVFGRKPDSQPMPEVAEWKFQDGGWLQVYQGPDRAGEGSFTLAVTDLEEEIQKLDKMDVDTSQRTSSPMVKTVMVVDLDGNHIAFAQTLDDSLAK